jgi:hypothetical protein
MNDQERAAFEAWWTTWHDPHIGHVELRVERIAASAAWQAATAAQQTEIERLRAEVTNLRTVMVAAAEEISAHWVAHCDAEGYGPVNLQRRLEEGIPSEYGYTAGAFAELKSEAERLRAERDAILQQAKIWKHEARAQRATVQECYQACTGSSGEPGDWHGAAPIRALVAERDALVKDAARYRWLRVWPYVAGIFTGLGHWPNPWGPGTPYPTHEAAFDAACDSSMIGPKAIDAAIGEKHE